MPINRFSTVGQSEYTSQHVPLPFEAIGALGAKTQTEYDKSLKDLEVTDPIAKLNPRAAMKVYNPNSSEGISDAALDWTSQKDQAVKMLNDEKNKITDEFMQTGNADVFKKKSRDYINKAAQIHSDLSAKEAIAKQVSDYNKELAKNKDFSVQGHLGQKLLDYNTQFFKDAAEGNIRDYSPFDIATPTDRPKEVKDYFDSMGKEILQSFSNPTNTGYIRTKYREGLSGDKISNVFNSWYQNSKVQDDIRLEALDLAARKGIDTKSEVTVKVPVSKNAKTGEITYKEEKMPWIDAYEEQALNQVKDMALGFKSSTGKDALTSDATFRWATDKKEKEENEARALVGQPIESQTFTNLITKDANYKDLTNLDIFTKGPNGVTLNWQNIANGKPIYIDSQGNKTTKSVDSEGIQNTLLKTNPLENQQKLLKAMRSMADAVNYQGVFKADNYQDILNKFNVYDKVRIFDEQMAAPVSKIETSKAERNWNNYDVMSPEDPTNPLPSEKKPVFSKSAGDQLILNNWRTAPNGKMNRDGYIKRKDGTIEPIMIRPKAIIDDGYHNAISNINLTGLKYEMGQVTGKPTKDGVTELIDQKIIPGVGIVEVLGYKNKDNNNQRTSIFTLTPTDNQGNPIGKPVGYKTQADLQQALNSKYYGTDAGFADRQSIANPKQTYESTESAEYVDDANPE